MLNNSKTELTTVALMEESGQTTFTLYQMAFAYT